MGKVTENKIEKFIRSLDIDNLDIIDYIDIDNINPIDAFNSIYTMIDDNNGFNVEIIYYYNAIEYLKNNDPSLKDSLDLANELGYTLNSGNINSELLASLLATQKLHEEFYSKQSEINNFFNSL